VSWLVVYTKSRQEAVAEQNLRNQGFDTLLPRLTQRRRLRGKWQDVRGPLFPRYLFMNVALGQQSLASVRSTIGVVDLIRFGARPATVPEAVIAYLAQQEDGKIAKDGNPWPHQPGNRVEILEGPFAGLQGVYRLAKDAERAALLVELLGRQNEIVVAHQHLSMAV